MGRFMDLCVKNVTAIALDLEGTLISNAVSQFPRPGLFDFLTFCQGGCDRLLIVIANYKLQTAN